MEIAIIGGGIGGLAAALRLHAMGFRPVVYEAARELKPLGVGIAIQPYGTRELTELGLGAELAAGSVEARDSIYLNRFGQHIYEEKVGPHIGYSHHQYMMHRGHLQMMLYRAVLDRLGPEAVRLGHHCAGFTQDATGVTAHFDDRPDARADVLIGADGVRSRIREQLHPGRGSPAYSGITLWRGVTLAKPYLSGGSVMHIGALRTGILMVYPILDQVGGSALSLTNWVLEKHGRPDVMEDWNRQGRLADIEHDFDDCRVDGIDIPALFRDAEAIYEYPMVDHEPLGRWSFGRVTLLGDAAHAMYPRGGNGSNQAIVDARVLAECLDVADDPVGALARYDSARRESANALVLACRGEGPNLLLTLVDQRTGGRRFEDIETVLPFAESDAIMRKYHRLAGMARPAGA
jgi:2-polyprenyl-6-methoxyphenol hydroxylase-like FAD-dependent oxidoreductase